jgi:hypothetical protein
MGLFWDKGGEKVAKKAAEEADVELSLHLGGLIIGGGVADYARRLKGLGGGVDRRAMNTIFYGKETLTR